MLHQDPWSRAQSDSSTNLFALQPGVQLRQPALQRRQVLAHSRPLRLLLPRADQQLGAPLLQLLHACAEVGRSGGNEATSGWRVGGGWGGGGRCEL